MPAHIALVSSTAVVPPADGGSAANAAAPDGDFAATLDQQLAALLGASQPEQRGEQGDTQATDDSPAPAVADATPVLPWPLQPLPATPPGLALGVASVPGTKTSAADSAQPGGSRGARTVPTLTETLISAQATAATDASTPFPLLHAMSDREGALPAPVGEIAATATPQLQAAAQQPAAPALPAVPIEVPVPSPDWREAFGDRVVLLAREAIQSAELHVTPPELGPVSVRIDVNGSEANIVFGVQHPDTRNAIADALPRLAELLAAQGLALGGAQVGAQLARDRQPGEAERTRADGGDDALPRIASASSAAVRRGLVDLFA
jgi:flagellar hook-length control protein FliK